MAWSTPYVDDILKPAIVEWHKKKNEGREEVIKHTCKELYAKQAANTSKLNPLKDAASLAGVSFDFTILQEREEDSSTTSKLRGGLKITRRDIARIWMGRIWGAANDRSKAGKGGKGKNKAVEENDEEQDVEDDEPAHNVDVPWHKRMTGPLMAKACDEEACKGNLKMAAQCKPSRGRIQRYE
ncbi:hypothetical protein PTI98_002266 [Pleurotus ostreatus]|nr:hypothetical protein PTI98_002266 [Pleurotus ostreatus]